MNLPPETISPNITLGPVHLVVYDLNHSLDFYQKVLGLQLIRGNEKSVLLTASRTEPGLAPPILALSENRKGRTIHGRTGLYHLAILAPNRRALAATFTHLLQSGWTLHGSADHGVSEAVYLADPDGNGIEIYHDRPKEEWPMHEDALHMGTAPLDLHSLIAELDATTAAWTGLHPQTRLGHVHLKVAEIGKSEWFYTHVLGFKLTQRIGPAASFVSAGGYHHHIGFNTWESLGASSPPPGSLGMHSFTIQLPSRADAERLAGRVRQVNLPVEETSGGFLVRDPSRNGILLK